MKDQIQIRRFIVCLIVATIAVGLGICNVCYSNDYTAINTITQLIIATVGFVAVSEMASMTSKFTVITYIIVSVVCAVVAHIVTPWNIILPRADLNSEVIQTAYHSAIISSFVSYSIALVLSVLIGVFFLHRKDIFKPHKTSALT